MPVHILTSRSAIVLSCTKVYSWFLSITGHIQVSAGLVVQNSVLNKVAAARVSQGMSGSSSSSEKPNPQQLWSEK